MIILGFASFFIGPDSTYTGIHKNIYITNIAFAVQGIGAAIV
jgi:hypothetical protein